MTRNNTRYQPKEEIHVEIIHAQRRSISLSNKRSLKSLTGGFSQNEIWFRLSY